MNLQPDQRTSPLALHETELVCSVRDLLYVSHLSIGELARRIGKQPHTLLGWVHNTTREFDFETLARLCAIFVFSDRAGTSHPLPPSAILELRFPGEDDAIRFVFAPDSDGYARPLAIPAHSVLQVNTLERLPNPFEGRIVCHLLTHMQRGHLTFAQLSDETGIARATLSEIARGMTVSIWRPTLLALCRRFGGVAHLFSYAPYVPSPMGSDS